MNIPSTRADLDALSHDDRAAFMSFLSGSLWRVQRDDEARSWVAVADDSLIVRYGFTQADFPDATPPGLPEWVDLPAPAVIVTPRQARLALDAAGLLTSVEAWIAAQSRAAQIDYESATEWRSDWPLIAQAATALNLTDEQIDALFESAQAL